MPWRGHRRVGPATSSRALGLAALLYAALAMANPYLKQARQLMGELRFREAAKVLEAARKVPATDGAEKQQTLELLARCQVAEGDRAGAERSFSELLTLEPHFALPADESPKIRAVFDASKAALYPRDFVRLDLLPSTSPFPRVKVVDPWSQVEELVLWTRAPGQAWAQWLGRRAGEVVAFHGVPEVECDWYLEARTAQRRTVASRGTAQSPQHFRPALVSGGGAPLVGAAPAASQHGTARRAAWVVAGVAVAAAAGGIYLESRAVRSAQQAQAAEWADDARRDQAAAQTQALWGTVLLAGAGAGAVAAGVLFVW